MHGTLIGSYALYIKTHLIIIFLPQLFYIYCWINKKFMYTPALNPYPTHPIPNSYSSPIFFTTIQYFKTNYCYIIRRLHHLIIICCVYVMNVLHFSSFFLFIPSSSSHSIIIFSSSSSSYSFDSPQFIFIPPWFLYLYINR